MIRALAFGGAFNPPTIAHIELAHEAMIAGGFEKVVFIPTKRSYVLDDQKKNFAFSDEQRLDMLVTIADHREWMDVSDYELTSESQPRTFVTLCHLQDIGYAPTLLFGSDKLPELETGWRHVEDICSMFGIVCMSRKEDNAQEMIDHDPYLSSLRNFITVVPTSDLYRDVSSSQVRKLIMAYKDTGKPEILERIRKMIPEELCDLKGWL